MIQSSCYPDEEHSTPCDDRKRLPAVHQIKCYIMHWLTLVVSPRNKSLTMLPALQKTSAADVSQEHQRTAYLKWGDVKATISTCRRKQPAVWTESCGVTASLVHADVLQTLPRHNIPHASGRIDRASGIAKSSLITAHKFEQIRPT